MSSKLYFGERVAVITGAGNGLGRVYALLLASRGAKIVVNDLGSDRNGSGYSKQPADFVVNEIKQNGGHAIANYDSVMDGEKIIQTALDHFGRIDILINNAGIIRDRSFLNISKKDWDTIHDVHLKGTFKTTQAAWPIFKKQKYGRIVMTASHSGICGNFGQANYSSAKMGIIGLANTLALEGLNYNIQCNVIVPIAISRLTEDLFPKYFADEFNVNHIAPVVAYLCHETNKENGAIIESGAGWASKIHSLRNQDVHLRKKLSDDITIETVRDAWNNITDMSSGTINKRNKYRFTHAIEAQSNPHIDESTFIFNSKTIALYALGIGASVNESNELKFLYENHSNFTPLPTFFALGGALRTNLIQSALQNTQFDLVNLLYGEHYIELFDKLPTDGVLKIKSYVVDVIDKKSGTVVTINKESRDQNEQLIAMNQMALFIIGARNANKKTKPSNNVFPIVSIPQRKPNASVQFKTHVDQAAIYRLSGDWNPMHIDPAFAKRGGQSQPILHGLCTLGISMRAILKTYANNDSTKFKAMKVRFVRPVIPGQTLQIDMWQNANRIHFTTTVVETQTTVINGAYVDLKIMPNEQFHIATDVPLQSDVIFDLIAQKLKLNATKFQAINGIFLYKIMKNKNVVREWTIDLKNGLVFRGTSKDIKANTTVTIDDADMFDIATGKLTGQMAFMQGKLKVNGDIMLLQKLAPLLKTEAKL